ncbi:ATP-dependent DNA helicase [Trichonephila clavipes]|nr:ATP-dependent DNA helicase [Trichonephila clavipes]
MAHKKSLEALNRTLKDLRGNGQLFGGTLILLAGDFQQTLPVIPRSTLTDELNACLKSSVLWWYVEKVSLKTYMRVHLHEDESSERFAKQLLDIRNDGDRFNSCQVIYSQFGLAIHQNDHQARRRFVEWAQNEIAVVPDFHKRILFSDEVHFWLNGYFNKQNCRIWSEANPQDDVKSLVYADKPQTLDHLEDNIRRVFADIRPQMLEKVIEKRTSRLDYIRASRGSHMPEIIFKM